MPVYTKILVPLDNSRADEAILAHVRGLAKLSGAALVFVHVADGFVARNQEALNLSDSPEIRADREYLAGIEAQFRAEGFNAQAVLERGDPAARILELAAREGCDLIAMATHGHRFLADVVLGSVAEQIRHRTEVPVLMLKTK